MTTEREALKLALEAIHDLEGEINGYRTVDFPIPEKAKAAIEEVLAQPPEERNYCPRCGKRAGKNAWDVHTCSLPEENT